jgi:hypothetical protein
MLTKMTLKKRVWIPLAILAALFLGALLAKPAYYFYKDVTFYWFDRTPTEKLVKAYCEKMHISYGRYPQSLIDLLERNPETQDFVLNYPFREDVEYRLVPPEEDQGVPLLLQWDSRWGYEIYGSDMMAITGCGPTCVAMVGLYLTGDTETFDPAAVASFSQKNGYYAAGYGSSWTLISEGAVKLGLDVTEIPLVEKRIKDNLEVGNPVICAMGPGDFTTSGHYIVLIGLEDGKFRVNDPNSREKSGQLWSYEQISGQIRNLWVIR